MERVDGRIEEGFFDKSSECIAFASVLPYREAGLHMIGAGTGLERERERRALHYRAFADLYGGAPTR